MITPQQRYAFDVQGYIVLKSVLDPAQVKRMQEEMTRRGVENPDNHPGLSRFKDFLTWGDDWRGLIDHEAILPFLHELLGSTFRLDHAYGMAMSADGKPAPEGHEMHHSADMFTHGCYYINNGRQMHNGLIVVSYALTDIAENVGGFICIPGSHNASVPIPAEYHSMKGNPLWRQVPQQAGDVLIFTEALTHGTRPWTNKNSERRSVLLKYCPGYMQWAAKVMDSSDPGLSERQKKILAGPYVNARPVI
jgi:ectoine hydroxylase-related dioxygenase (phytanoyl-CoA dioxygenase family)